MRELTKSIMRISWALPLFGVQQASRLAMPTRDAQERSASSFDAVGAAAREGLGPALSSAFEAGDRLQRTIVDSMFALVPIDPGQVLESFTGGRARPEGAPSPPRSTPPQPTPPRAPASAPSPAPARDGQGQGWGPVPAE